MNSSPCKSTAMNARISDANGEIAKLILQKRYLQPGSSIMGFVDFRSAPSASRTCCQFMVSLISKEKLPNSNSMLEPLAARLQDFCRGELNKPLPIS